jgi:tetratricopeptide (TPR) repeat protein
MAREAEDKHFTAFGLLNLGNVANDQGDFAQARPLYEESLAIWREMGNGMRIAEALSDLGKMMHAQGDHALARVHFEESLTLSHELGFKQGIAQSLEAFAFLALQEAHPERAVRLWGAAAALREMIRSPLAPDEREQQEREITVLQQTLGEDAFASAWAEGQAWTLEQAIEYAFKEEV